MLKKINRIFDRFAQVITRFVGSSYAFGIAFFIILLWVISGPIFNYSDTWQLVINTGTTIITFLMVFLIQRSQNKDSLSVEIKLNELIASTKNASNHLVDIESLTEEDLDAIHKYYSELAAKTKNDSDIKRSHSIKAIKDNNGKR